MVPAGYARQSVEPPRPDDYRAIYGDFSIESPMNLPTKQKQEEAAMKTKQSWNTVIVMVLSVLTARPVHAGYNIGTRFADVIMEYIQPGKVYNPRTMRNLPYRIENHSNGEADMEV